MKLLERLIPPQLKEDVKNHRSARLIITIDLFILAMGLVFAGIFAALEYQSGAFIMAYAAVNAIVFIFLMYFTRNFFLCGNFFSLQSWLVFSGLIITSGGTHSPYFMWLLTIPPIAVFYMRSRYAFFWLWLVVFTAIAIAGVELFGGPFPNDLPQNWHPFLLILNYSLVLLLFLSVVRSFREGYLRITRKLKSLNDKLLRSNEELERFAHITSHDLKSPLRNIISFLTLFNRRYGHTVEAEPKEYLDIARRNAVQMQTLIEDILEYSKMNETAVRKENVDLNHLFCSISQQLKETPFYRQSEILISHLPTVVADPARLHQLFQNLVENGLKYNKSEQPKVEIHYFSEPENHHFVVQDNGIGIAAEYHDKVFKMFERLHNQELYTGTGIGLAICQKNVAEYDGEIFIESEEGQGTSFHIKLPKGKMPEILSPQPGVLTY